MRGILYIFMAIFFTSCAGTKNAVTNTNKLNGAWVPVKEEMSGKDLPAAIMEHQKLTINDTTYIMAAESVDNGSVKYNGNKMDIYGREGVNAGKHFTAIYKYENEQLTICYNLAGDSYPDAFETKGKPTYFLAVFKRAGK